MCADEEKPSYSTETQQADRGLSERNWKSTSGSGGQGLLQTCAKGGGSLFLFNEIAFTPFASISVLLAGQPLQLYLDG